MARTNRGRTFISALRRLFTAEAPAPQAPSEPAPAKSRARRETLPVGKFSFVGLRHIRDELGARWPGMAERVHSLAESVISRHLLHGDVFEVDAEGDYVVLFCQLSEREAEFKARAIGREITQRLLGTEWRQLSTVETLVAAIPASVPVGDDIDAVLQDAFRNGRRFTTSEDDEPEPGAAGPDPFSGEADSDWERAGGGSAPDATEPRRGRASGQDGDAPIPRPPPDWRYTPIWDFRTEALIHFRIIRTVRGRRTGPPAETEFAEVFADELAGLRKAAADMLDLAGQGRRLPVICPFHCAPLSLPSNRREVIATIRDLPLPIRRMMTIELAAETVWPRTRALEEFTEMLKSLGASTAAGLPLLMSSLSGLADLPRLVTLQLPAQRLPERTVIRFLDAFAGRAAKARRECGLSGAATRSLTIAASAAGFRYLSGPAIHGDVKRLGQATRFDIGRLYADLLRA
jgi:hypothetical protein